MDELSMSELGSTATDAEIALRKQNQHAYQLLKVMTDRYDLLKSSIEMQQDLNVTRSAHQMAALQDRVATAEQQNKVLKQQLSQYRIDLQTAEEHNTRILASCLTDVEMVAEEGEAAQRQLHQQLIFKETKINEQNEQIYQLTTKVDQVEKDLIIERSLNAQLRTKVEEAALAVQMLKKVREFGDPEGLAGEVAALKARVWSLEQQRGWQ